MSAVCSTGAFAEGIERNDRPSFVAAAHAGGVGVHAWCVVDAIEAGAVRLTDTLNGARACCGTSTASSSRSATP